MNEKDLYEEENINDAMNKDDNEEEEDDIIIDDNEEEIVDRVDDNDNNNNKRKEQDNTNTNVNDIHIINSTTPSNNQPDEINNNDILNFLLNNPITIPRDTSPKVNSQMKTT